MSLSDLRDFVDPHYGEMFAEIDAFYAPGGGAEMETTQRHSMDANQERVLSPHEIEEARRAGQVFVALMQKVRGSMMHRDRIYYELGLRAAHLEEALAQGDVERAFAHYQAILRIARMLTP
jgi:hypothetical protein